MVYLSEVITSIQKKLCIILYNNIKINLSPTIFCLGYTDLLLCLQKLECKSKIAIASVNNKKGKAIPLQAWTGCEGSRRLRVPNFMTIGT